MLFTIAAVVSVLAVINSVLPAIGRAANEMVLSADVADDRLSSRLEIIHATGQDAGTEVDVWVKNIGATRIIALDKIDLFFGQRFIERIEQRVSLRVVAKIRKSGMRKRAGILETLPAN